MTAPIIRVARAIEEPACTQAVMDGSTDTSGSAMSTERQIQPWTRSASSTRLAFGDQASAPGTTMFAMCTLSQSAQLSSEPLTIAAADGGSCVPAPLSSAFTLAIWGRENSPDRALGLHAPETAEPGSAMRGPRQVAEREAH